MAPKGNKHAFKHGIYSPYIAAMDEEALQSMKHDSNKDELAYARVRLAAAQERLKAATDDETRLKWDYACRHWTEIILTAISNNSDRPAITATIYTTLLDAVRAANDRENWT